mgnify:CR=1 FL=1
MFRWFRRLMPHEAAFFDMFARHADQVVRGAEELRAMLEGGDQGPAIVPGHPEKSLLIKAINHAGKLKMPKQGALYTITTPRDAWDPKAGVAKNAMVLSVIYMPFATTEDTGITSVPQKSGPWLMFPGSPKAHVMLSGSM